jgi:hypothetical protein
VTLIVCSVPLGFDAAETELAVEELAGTIGFESATDREKAFGIRAREKKGISTTKHGCGRGRCGDNGNGGTEIRGIGVGCRGDCNESGIRNGLGPSAESGRGNGAAILGGTTAAADTPRNATAELEEPVTVAVNCWVVATTTLCVLGSTTT